MIPPFNDLGLLPPGLYDTTLSEIRFVLGGTTRRETLLDGLERYLDFWNESGFLVACIIDGSFVTTEFNPGDVDIILVPSRIALQSERYERLLRSYALDWEFVAQEFGCQPFPAVMQGDEVTGQTGLDGLIDTFSYTMGRRQERGLLRVRFPL